MKDSAELKQGHVLRGGRYAEELAAEAERMERDVSYDDAQCAAGNRDHDPKFAAVIAEREALRAEVVLLRSALQKIADPSANLSRGAYARKALERKP